MKKSLLLTLLVIFTTPLFARNSYEYKLIELAKSKELHKKRYWHALLHYKENTFGGYTSQLITKQFFNAPNGKTDPESELAATIRSFFKSPKALMKKEDHPQCDFNERLAFLKKELNIDMKRLPKANCSRFEKWKKELNVDSLTIVFASYYMNNPASAFGHTFMRLNAGGWRKKVKLINYGVNYGGDVPDDMKGIRYTLGGIFGWFPGSFTTFPYYMKVQEYSNIEWRDIWEYDLIFTKEEISHMMGHLWELGGNSFSYYFFKENCSYHILSLLEIMRPNLILKDSFKFAWVIPGSTIKLLYEHNLISKKSYRPSLVSKFKQRHEILSETERDIFDDLKDDPKSLSSTKYTSLKDQNKARVLDTYFEYLHYKEAKAIANSKGKKKKSKEDIEKQKAKKRKATLAKLKFFIERSKIKYKDDASKFPPKSTSPDLGHEVAKASFGGGSNENKTFSEFGFWFAYHDILANEVGFDPTSHMVLMQTQLRYYNESKKFRLEHIKIAEAKAMTPMDVVATPTTWKFSFNVERRYDLNCENCHTLSGNYGVGIAFKTNNYIPVHFYTYLDSEAHIGTKLNKKYELGAGNSTGLIFKFGKSIKAHLLGQYVYNFLGHTGHRYKINLEGSYLISKNSDIRLKYKRVKRFDEVAFVLNFYY